MPPRKELCRNFQRGSCQYGDRCKFLHATAQQQSKTNPFGFGMQTSNAFQPANQQQQMPNPFGFGMQNKNQLRGGNDFGSKPNQSKPFENKWSRFPAANNNGASASRPSDNQTAADHKCTNSESCKRIIVEDSENEKPLWKLTCYGHNKNGPCDIVGDISCEELRALAYDDSKNGKSLQFIIDRERSLLNSKLVEFQNLVQKPYSVSSVANTSTHNLFGGGTANATIMNNDVSPPSTQNLFGGGSANATIMNNGFSPPSTQNLFAGGSSANATTMNNGFSPPASSFSQLQASLGTGSAAVPNYNFGQSSAFQSSSQPSSMFQTNNSPFNSSGSFGPASFSPSAISARSNPFPTLANASQTGNVFGKQLNFASSEPNFASNAIGQSHISIQLSNNIPKENANVDGSIWKKAEWKWNAGEIPEDAPPDVYIH